MAIGIYAFLFLGALGVYFLMLSLTGNHALGAVAGIALICAKYTVTNWLVRGAVAELSAAMIFPWIMLNYLASIREGKVKPWFSVTLALSFLCHAVMCYYLILILILTTVILALGKRLPDNLRNWRSYRSASFVFLAINGLYLLALVTIGGEYDMMRMITDDYQPSTHTQPLGRYLWDDQWRFGKTASGLSVQVDSPSVALVGVGIVIFIWGKLGGYVSAWLAKHKLRLFPVLADCGFGSDGLLALMSFLAISVFLQTRYAHVFYYNFPGAIYIQFPWRLLSYITPVAIVIPLLVVSRFPVRTRDFLSGAYVSAMVVLCGAFVPSEYGRFDVTSVNTAPAIVSFSWFGEFVPRRAPLPIYNKDKVLLAAANHKCRLVPELPIREAQPVAFQATCARPATISLPLFYTFAHRVMMNGDMGHPGGCLESERFPALCTVSLPAGTSRIEVVPPSIFTVPLRLFGW